MVSQGLGNMRQPPITCSTLLATPAQLSNVNVRVLGFASARACFSQDTFIPLKHAPLVSGLELLGNAAGCLGTGDNNAVSPVVNTSSWVIEQPQIQRVIVTPDS